MTEALAVWTSIVAATVKSVAMTRRLLSLDGIVGFVIGGCVLYCKVIVVTRACLVTIRGP
jgi:hypothetical protein